MTAKIRIIFENKSYFPKIKCRAFPTDSACILQMGRQVIGTDAVNLWRNRAGIAVEVRVVGGIPLCSCHMWECGHHVPQFEDTALGGNGDTPLARIESGNAEQMQAALGVLVLFCSCSTVRNGDMPSITAIDVAHQLTKQATMRGRIFQPL